MSFTVSLHRGRRSEPPPRAAHTPRPLEHTRLRHISATIAGRCGTCSSCVIGHLLPLILSEGPSGRGKLCRSGIFGLLQLEGLLA